MKLATFHLKITVDVQIQDYELTLGDVHIQEYELTFGFPVHLKTQTTRKQRVLFTFKTRIWSCYFCFTAQDTNNIADHSRNIIHNHSEGTAKWSTPSLQHDIIQ